MSFGILFQISLINRSGEGICALTPCTNSALTDINTNVTNACAADFNFTAPLDIADVQSVYLASRNISCLEEYVSYRFADIFQQMTILCFVINSTSTNTSCSIQALTNIQSIIGTLDLDSYLNSTAILTVPLPYPANVTCTDCIKETYNILKAEFPNSVTNITSALQSLCGSAFVGQFYLFRTYWLFLMVVVCLDGQTPSDIAETAVSATINGATLLSVRGALTALVISLVAVSSGLVSLV
jgi:hypothetical protein